MLSKFWFYTKNHYLSLLTRADWFLFYLITLIWTKHKYKKSLKFYKNQRHLKLYKYWTWINFLLNQTLDATRQKLRANGDN